MWPVVTIMDSIIVELCGLYPVCEFTYVCFFCLSLLFQISGYVLEVLNCFLLTLLASLETVACWGLGSKETKDMAFRLSQQKRKGVRKHLDSHLSFQFLRIFRIGYIFFKTCGDKNKKKHFFNVRVLFFVKLVKTFLFFYNFHSYF